MTNSQELNALVDRIVETHAAPNPVHTSTHAPLDFHAKVVIDNLPSNLSESDLTGILKLALLTESATDSFAAFIIRSARRTNAPWLERFMRNVWIPDELTHHVPYKQILMGLGYLETDLDREMNEVRDKDYLHCGGDRPINITTFGMIQEYCTDKYHGAIAGMLRESAPRAATTILRIKQQETLHCVWYRNMTTSQIAMDPELITEIAEELSSFKMPGAIFAPDLHELGKHWFALMGGDFTRTFRDLLRLVHSTLKDERLTGKLLVELAEARNIKLGPLPFQLVMRAFMPLERSAHTLLGEAVLERAGLEYLFTNRKDRSAASQLRDLMRSWIASHLPDPVELTLNPGS